MKEGILEKVGKVVIDDCSTNRPQIPKSPEVGTELGTIRGEIMEENRTLVTYRVPTVPTSVPRWLWAEEIPSPNRPHKRRRRIYRSAPDFARYLAANGPATRKGMLHALNQGDDVCSASTLDRWIRSDPQVGRHRQGREIVLTWAGETE